MMKHRFQFTFFLLICLTVPVIATAQVIDIPDSNLRDAVKQALGKRFPPGQSITVEEMATLTRLEARKSGIWKLTGLEYATNLTSLSLKGNNIFDISPLAGLTNLTHLELGNGKGFLLYSRNSIRNLSPLTGLTNLTSLGLSDINISNISPLAGLTNLTRLDLRKNKISDISALSGLINLRWLSLEDNKISDISALVSNTGLGDGDKVVVLKNPLSLQSIDTHIPMLASRGVTVEFHLLVNLPDPSLRAAIEKELGKEAGDLISVGEMATFSALETPNANISNLTGLEYATKLRDLDLSNNSISDISVLAELNDLNELALSNNSIADISALSGLTKLDTLDLSNNSISDISALAGLINLDALDLSNNNISDLFPLIANLGRLKRGSIYLSGNPLSDTSINTHIPTLRGRGVEGLYRSKLILSTVPPVAVGETFTLNLTVKNVYNLAGFELDIVFDAAVLKAISINEGDFLSKDGGQTFFQEGNINNAGGKIIGINGAFIGAGGVDGNGTLLTITFEAKTAGRGAVQLSKAKLGASNGTQIHAEIIVHAVIVGLTYDLNGDGQVDILDIVFVSQNFGQANSKADVNHDGSVDVFDLIAVGQHATSAPKAPSGQGSLNFETIQEWIDMAHTANNGSLLGIANLERLLEMMLPDKTFLLANYPNPFNPETWIPYQLANNTDVKISIYDSEGGLVRRLDFGHQQAGYYTNRSRAAYWDGRNELGDQVSSGIYFYQLRAGDVSPLRKMLILK